MTTPEPPLAERIRTAEQAGDWQEARQLKAAQLVSMSTRTDHNGRIGAEPVPAAAPEEPAAPDPRPVLDEQRLAALRPGALPAPPESTRAEQINALEQSGDYTAAGRLKAQWLTERAEAMNSGGDW